MKFGCAWYPEHWPKERWPVDIALMRKAHMNVARVAEFAWSSLEPAEGSYEFAWLDDAIRLLGEAGMETVLGTPTAAPPAWLTQAHPEVLALEENGRALRHGSRCHFNPNSRVYRDYCARIAGKMAERYGKNPSVIGWQLDNEINRASFDPETRAAFHSWLQDKYRTLDRLNADWTTAYWSQTYSDWTQIPLPDVRDNPGLRLEWKRFCTSSYVDYLLIQSRAIRAHSEGQWITTNCMGLFKELDYYAIGADLDFLSNDRYWPTDQPDPANEAFMGDFERGWKRKNFWMMETQPSGVNWASKNTLLEPGRLRLRNWQFVAHGADAVLYWQWRNALGGQEQLHGSVIGQDGEPRPCFPEIKALGAEFSRAAPLLRGTSCRSEAAILFSYESQWAIDFQRHHQDYDYQSVVQALHKPFFGRHLGVDVINAHESIEGYKLVAAPALWLLDDAMAGRLRDFVHAGGLLVLTQRSGCKDPLNRLYPSLPPGPLAALAGLVAEEALVLTGKVQVRGAEAPALKGTATLWGERLRLESPDVRVLASFGSGNGWLQGRPAVTLRKAGKGRVAYLAGCFDPALTDKVMARMFKLAGLKQRFTGPKDIEFASRTSTDGSELLFVLNHSSKTRQVKAPAGREVLKDRACRGSLSLKAWDVAVIEVKKAETD
ncbi:MAG TPA: beta-galactosidase [bacterium]|jgi:beta-galactosidase|nr:beta-galactosidase [bacterium]